MLSKEIQDKAWSILSKEFRDYVKGIFTTLLNKKDPTVSEYGYIGLLIKLFREHNLTSDAEPEEMLVVPRKRVQRMYTHYDKISNDSSRPKDYIEIAYEYADGAATALYDLFSSKCLPDKKAEEITDKYMGPVKEHFAKDEPKFKVGDKVRVITDGGYSGQVDIIKNVRERTDRSPIYQLEQCLGPWTEDALEPYTEPTNDTSNEGIDLDELNTKLDKALESETKESLEEFHQNNN